MQVLPASEQAADGERLEVPPCEVMVDRTEDIGEVDGAATAELSPEPTTSDGHEEKTKTVGETESDGAVRPGQALAEFRVSAREVFFGLVFDQVLLVCATFRLLLTIYFCGCIGTLIGSEKPTLQMFIQSNALTNLLAPALDTKFKKDSAIQFYAVHSVDDVYDWLTDTLIPTVFTTTDHTGALLPDYEHGRIGYANQVLGGVMLEMTPKTLEPCDSTEAFVGLYQTCVSDSESPSSSEFLDIRLNVSDATDVITTLKESGSWVNYYSKELRVTVATYNAEVDAFSVTRLSLGFLDTGTMQLKASTDSIPDYREQDVTKVCVLVIVFLVAGVCMFFLERPERKPAQEAIKSTPSFAQHAVSSVFSLVMFVVEFGAIPVFFALLIQALTLDFDTELSWIADAASSPDKFLALQELLESFDRAVDELNALAFAGALTIIQLGFFVLRQMRFHPQLNIFARTVETSLRRFFGFFFVFMIIFLAFSFMATVSSASACCSSPRPRNPWSCVNMLFGEFDFDSIREISASTGATCWW